MGVTQFVEERLHRDIVDGGAGLGDGPMPTQ